MDDEPSGARAAARLSQSLEADSLLSSLHRVAAGLRDGVEATRRDPSAGAPGRPEQRLIVDLSLFEARARQIAALRRLHAELEKLAAAVARYGSAADALHRDELRAMQDYLSSADSLRHPPPREGAPSRGAELTRGVPWKDRALTAKIFGWPPPAEPPAGAPPRPKGPPPAPAAGPAPRAARGSVALAPNVSLDALIVPPALTDPREILDAVASPELYYVPLWDHFAVRVGAVVFHGNIGRVYPPAGGGRPSAGGPPRRVKECRRAGCRGAGGCAYYHDPAEVPGSRDVRNFMADSWLYVPAASLSAARYGSRRLGSRDGLEADLCGVSAADARRHVDQTAHDIICAVVLAKYVL